jgi:hypothetical protein
MKSSGPSLWKIIIGKLWKKETMKDNGKASLPRLLNYAID